MRKVFVVCGLTVAISVGLAGVASSAEKPEHATAEVQHNNNNCGFPESGEPITGSAKFTRIHNKVKVQYKVKQLEAGTEYTLELFGNSCVHLGNLAKFTAKKNGSGAAKGEMEVPAGDTEFFADAWNGKQGNDSFIVSLP